MTELNMYPTWSFVRIKATYTNIMPSGGVSYAPFRHFVLLKKYIVYGQGPIAWIVVFAGHLFGTFWVGDVSSPIPFTLLLFTSVAGRI